MRLLKRKHTQKVDSKAKILAQMKIRSPSTRLSVDQLYTLLNTDLVVLLTRHIDCFAC